MQWKRRLNKGWQIILHPTVIVIPFAITVWLLIPGIHNRYKCELIRTQIFNEGVQSSYEDFDGDGYSERILTGPSSGKMCCTLHNRTKCYQQFNFQGSFPSIWRYICGDINDDNKKELFLFTVNNDSLFIHYINPIEKSQELIKDKFITVVRLSQKEDWSIRKGLLFDLNKDGSKEAIILVTAGFQKEPRRVFAYDVINDTVLISPDFGAFGTNISAYTENNRPTIAVSNYASCNYADTTREMNDHYAYFIILDEKLQYKYPLKKVKGSFCYYDTQPYYSNGNTLLLTQVVGTDNEPGCRITLSDLTEKSIVNRLFNFDQESFKSFSTFTDADGNTKILGIYRYDQLVLLDNKLNVTKRKKIKTERHWEYFEDLNKDGQKELIFSSVNPNEIIITREDLSSPVKVKVSSTGYVYPLSTILRGNEPPHFSMQVDNIVYYYKYSAFIPWKEYSILAAIYLLILGFTLMIRRIQQKQLKKKFAMQQTISELKLLSIRNQMDPHFTYNILNTIGSFILQNKPDESYRMLMNYSKLLRTTLHASDTILGSLQEEIDFVTNYLELQKVRFKDKLCYTLTVSPDVDQSAIVPKMVIYTYVENSVKHGFSGLGKPGAININISSDDSFIKISITDNGIGRKKASEKGTDSGKGHKIMHQFYSLLNEINQGQISEQITDLVDEDGFPVGTEVILTVPTDLRFVSGENQGDVYNGLSKWRKAKQQKQELAEQTN